MWTLGLVRSYRSKPNQSQYLTAKIFSRYDAHTLGISSPAGRRFTYIGQLMEPKQKNLPTLFIVEFHAKDREGRVVGPA